MNKIITVLLIVLGVLLILGFTSLNLEGGNVILYLISVFVIGFFAGGFSNLDNITRTASDNKFYQREVSHKNAIIQRITLERDKFRLAEDNRQDDINQLMKLEDTKEAILRQYRGMEDSIDMGSMNNAIETLRRKLGFYRGK